MFTSFSAWALDFLSKAAGHKYIKRIPYSSGGKTRYRYIYKVTHTARGKHALHQDDVTVGAAFMLGTDKGAEVHAHVKSVDGDKVTVEYDDGPRKGEKETMSKRDLLSKLDAAHGISAALQSEREKQAKVVSELRASGASEKQIAREQARLDRLGVKAKEPEAKEPEAEKPKVKEPEAEKPKVKEPEAEKPKGQEPDKFPGQALIDLEQWLSDINNLKLSNMEESRIDRIRSLSIHHIDNVRHMVKLAKKPRYIRADVAQEVKEAVATAAPHLADLIKRHTIAQIMNVDGEMDVPDFSGAITAARNALHRQLLSLAKKDETTAASTDGRIRSTRDLAERFAAHIMQEHPEIKAQVWERGDKMRVYVKQYVNGRPVEYGHYDIKRTADEVEIVSNLNTTHTGRLLSRLPRPFIQSVDLDM